MSTFHHKNVKMCRPGFALDKYGRQPMLCCITAAGMHYQGTATCITAFYVIYRTICYGRAMHPHITPLDDHTPTCGHMSLDGYCWHDGSIVPPELIMVPESNNNFYIKTIGNFEHTHLVLEGSRNLQCRADGFHWGTLQEAQAQDVSCQQDVQNNVITIKSYALSCYRCKPCHCAAHATQCASVWLMAHSCDDHSAVKLIATGF